MAKTLDFNKLKRPHLLLVMPDEKQTRIKVSTPTEGLIGELQAALPELMEVFDAGDSETIAAVYDLAARLINNNLSAVTVTAEELAGKYGLNLEYLVAFFDTYVDFIGEITAAKNLKSRTIQAATVREAINTK